MSKNRNFHQKLLELGRNEGPGVVHLPYTPGFEEICRRDNPSATREDMHRAWEEVARAGGIVTPDEETIDSEDATPAPPIGPSPNTIPIQPPARISRPPEENGLLFQLHEDIPELQPWSAPTEPVLTPEKEDRRQKMLADVADSRLGSTEQRIAFILQHFPETRDSDTALCIRYWKKFQAEVIEKVQPLVLEVLFGLDRIETLGRVRRLIQNELRLFRGLDETRKVREAMQVQFHEYLAAHRQSLPEVRFYLDETGGDFTYTGIAGLCIINWKQFEKHSAALEQWRSRQGWLETIHFCDTGDSKLDRAVSLLHQLQKRRSGLLFLGYALNSRGRTDRDQLTLFVQLVLDSLKYLRKHGCLTEPRSVRIIKEAQTGFDNVYLRQLHQQLSDAVALEFPGELSVLPVETVQKGRTVLLECADVIAGGMQRRALHKGRNPKDRLAEAVVNVTGFEDGLDSGAVFKHYH